MTNYTVKIKTNNLEPRREYFWITLRKNDGSKTSSYIEVMKGYGEKSFSFGDACRIDVEVLEVPYYSPVTNINKKLDRKRSSSASFEFTFTGSNIMMNHHVFAPRGGKHFYTLLNQETGQKIQLVHINESLLNQRFLRSVRPGVWTQKIVGQVNPQQVQNKEINALQGATTVSDTLGEEVFGDSGYVWFYITSSDPQKYINQLFNISFTSCIPFFSIVCGNIKNTASWDMTYTGNAVYVYTDTSNLIQNGIVPFSSVIATQIGADVVFLANVDSSPNKIGGNPPASVYINLAS